MLIQSNHLQPIQPIPVTHLQRDLEYARLARAVYRNQPHNVPGWSELKEFRHDDSPGYRAAVYEKSPGGELVLAYAGTDDGATEFPWYDWQANIYQGIYGGGSQYRHAIDDAAEAQLTYMGRPIRFVGHSLGGGLASATAIVNGKRATTFNAAGVHSWTTGGLGHADQLIDAYRVQGEVLTTLQDSILLGWILPNSVGKAYYLPGTSSDMESCRNNLIRLS